MDSSLSWRLIVEIFTIVSVIIAVIQFIRPHPLKKLIKESNETLVKILRRAEETTTKLKDMDEAMISKKALQVQEAIKTLKNTYDTVNKYIKHKKEISEKCYLKKLSSAELVKLAFDEQKTAEKINKDVITIAFTQAIFPFDKNDDTADVMMRLYNQKRYENNKVLLDKLQKWATAMATATSQLTEYVRVFTLQKNQTKPEHRLFDLCKKSILLEEELDFLVEWTKYLNWYIDYLSDLHDYYIKNQSNNK